MRSFHCIESHHQHSIINCESYNHCVVLNGRMIAHHFRSTLSHMQSFKGTDSTVGDSKRQRAVPCIVQLFATEGVQSRIIKHKEYNIPKRKLNEKLFKKYNRWNQNNKEYVCMLKFKRITISCSRSQHNEKENVQGRKKKMNKTRRLEC